LTSFVCLLTGAASGREIRCTYDTNPYFSIWPTFTYCVTRSIDYSAKFETEKHSFTGSPSKKSETKTFYIKNSDKLDFIPLDILTEFPDLNGLIIQDCNLPTVKSGLFKAELNNIEYLFLESNEIEVIEPKAFEHLNKLIWIVLRLNKIQTLSYRFLKNHPDLKYISLEHNQINAIHPNFFDGLPKLKVIDLVSNDCIHANIGCKNCTITQEDLKSGLKECFDNCKDGSVCNDSYLHMKLYFDWF
jgi:hypothetical protein